jgi:hypothetical protein
VLNIPFGHLLGAPNPAMSYAPTLAAISTKQLKTIFILAITLLTFGQSNGQTKKVLTDKFYGQWINTSLFDSTKIKKQLSPWMNELYGTAVLEISRDRFNLFGCMDGGPMEKVSIIDPLHFTTAEISLEPKFEYFEKSDLIKMTTKGNFLSVTFRRVKTSDKVDIVTNESKFESYFKSLFFDSYLKVDKGLKVDKLWIGFETHIQFEFDAFGVRTTKGDIIYYGWEQTDNTLRIYKTTRNTDSDSGFYYWTKGELEREIKLK